MAKKFTMTKEVEYKHGKVNTWYMVRLENDEDGSTQFIDCSNTDDEKEAQLMFENAVAKYVPTSKTVVKEVVVE